MLSSPIVVLIPPSMQMTDDQFFEFCQVNRDLRIERNKLGEVSIMRSHFTWICFEYK
jgi:Uma2 family endonuclease